MWSSLSAYLYNDDDATKDSVAASSSPAAAAAVPRPPTSTRNNISPASNSLRTPSPRSSPLTIAMSGGSKKGSPSPALSRVSFDRSDNTPILRGIIVGIRGTGKTSLIRRLRGEDPFQKQQSNKSGQQRSRPMALVPWNVPPNAEKINNLVIEQEERVQLYVSESIGFVRSQEEQSFRKEWSTVLQAQRGKEWNFVVWMIDPKMEGMLQYLQLGLEILYPATAAAAATSEKRKLPLVQHLCILLNFRDMQEDGKSSTFSQARKIVETVRKNTELGNDDAKSPIIVVYESSMRDSFGLEQLHSFITLPYLAQKENELLRRVKLAQKQQMHLTKTLMESKVADYNDFVSSDDQLDIEEKPDTPKEKIERRRLEEEKLRLKKQLKQQQQELDSRMHRRKSPVIIDNQIVSNESPKENHRETIQGSVAYNRKLFQTPVKPETTKSAEPQKVVGEMSLESFFSEDESDDEVEAPRQMLDKRRSKPNGTQMKASARVQVFDSDDSSSDSDDSDDDFYIDISGTRSSTVFTKIRKIEPTVTVDSSEDIQSNVEGKGGDANDGNTSNENNENGAGNEKDSDSIQSDAGAAGEEQEKAKETTEHVEGSSNDEDDEENDESNLNEADEPENANAPSKPIDSGADPEDANSFAECDKEEEGGAVSSHSGDKKEEEGGDTSSIDDDEIKNGEDFGGDPEVPANGANVENDTAKTEANDDSAETDSSGTDKSVIKTEEEKVVPNTSNQDDDDDMTEEETPHGSDGGVRDEPDEENVASDEALQDQHLDDVSEEKSTSAAPNHQNQTLNKEDESEEDEASSSRPKGDTPDDGGNESDDECIVPASREEPTRDDDDDDSEDEFIIPASNEDQPNTKHSKLSEDLGDAVHQADNVSIESDHASPTQSMKHVANGITETKTNGTSATTNSNIATVSSAALAAIEQARLEAEQMMVQSQPTKPKKEKKKKKEKSKKEKKAKKSKKKDESAS